MSNRSTTLQLNKIMVSFKRTLKIVMYNIQSKPCQTDNNTSAIHNFKLIITQRYIKSWFMTVSQASFSPIINVKVIVNVWLFAGV